MFWSAKTFTNSIQRFNDASLVASVLISSACRKPPAYKLLMDNPTPETGSCLRSGSTIRRKSAGDSTEPCFTPISTEKLSVQLHLTGSTSIPVQLSYQLYPSTHAHAVQLHLTGATFIPVQLSYQLYPSTHAYTWYLRAINKEAWANAHVCDHLSYCMSPSSKGAYFVKDKRR